METRTLHRSIFRFQLGVAAAMGLCFLAGAGLYYALLTHARWDQRLALLPALGVMALGGGGYLAWRLRRIRQFRRWAQAAETARKAGDWAQARDAYEQVLRYNDVRGFVPYLQLGRAVAHLHLGEEATAEAILSAYRATPLIRARLAGLREARGDYAGLAALLEEPRAAGAADEATLHALAGARWRLGDREAARAVLAEARTRFPDSDRATESLRRIAAGQDPLPPGARARDAAP